MREILIACLIAVGTGWASAVIPVINAEALALAGGAVTSVHGAIFVTLALAIGTVFGKCTLFLGVRTGKNAVARKRAMEAEEEIEHRDKDAPRGRWAKLRDLLMENLDHPWRGPLVVFIGGSVGIPPLFITASVAGLSQMRIVPFAIAVFTGRWIRFLVIAIPAALAFHH
ncbi:VTT domain-containing protein [Nocardioides sp. Kera G14]|uniref:VTT domain-containing protein n=1 Tax=Nocardioides sp. Kera G14 TaxID=2884264 RepID=UPI001D0F8DFD|nr:VTT domain-containing protein [Nocardioides sp. Kera G14]UDY23789.1 VTT domain-containing protein [Nocardioides sp. Kera G14]